jgi:integral membrane protein (TIGR01906 family)
MKTIKETVGFLITLTTPFVFLMLAVRLLLTPFFLEFEYHTPNFPADTYGFTLQDRLHWSKISVDYLINNQGIEFLASQRLSDGSPLYSDRELSHMLDVKVLVEQLLAIWTGVLIFWLLVFLLAWLKKCLRDFWAAVSRGGWLTLALLAAVILLVFIDFDALFTAFHHLFFTGDTWLFYYSDNLIRLFPMRFWRDAFLLTGGITVLLALIAALSQFWKKNKKVI